MRVVRLASLGIVLAVAACSGTANLVHPFGSEDGSSTAPPRREGGSGAPLAASARTTLLEENEHLRDLLSKALADKRELDIQMGDAAKKIHEQEGELASRQEAVAALTERVQHSEQELAKYKDRAERLEQERKTLAEMYAVEKRQRLAFEKELLEREIAERTHMSQPAAGGKKDER